MVSFWDVEPINAHRWWPWCLAIGKKDGFIPWFTSSRILGTYALPNFAHVYSTCLLPFPTFPWLCMHQMSRRGESKQGGSPNSCYIEHLCPSRTGTARHLLTFCPGEKQPQSERPLALSLWESLPSTLSPFWGLVALKTLGVSELPRSESNHRNRCLCIPSHLLA